ncbi:MAG: HesA/MoeB/ThiF family protein [Bacillota bacterium]
MSLTEQEILRYSRHIILPEVGGRGQKRLKGGSVLIAGLGPAGSAAALYLAAAGIGKLTLWDPGLVTPADLESAIAHDRSRVGVPRARSAREPLSAINPAAEVVVLDRESDVTGAVAEHQVLLATTGDWQGMQGEAIRCGAAAVFAAAHGASGVALAYRQGEPCLGCVEPDRALALGLRPEGEGTAVAAAAGVIGVVAATEAVKLILGEGTPLTGRILAYDGWEARFREAPVTRRESCPMCGQVPG